MELPTEICIRILKAARKTVEKVNDPGEYEEWIELIEELEGAIADTGVI